MFCPKCGLQNTDETRFCRGCGAELSFVLAALEGKRPDTLDLSQKHISLFSRAIRVSVLGLGFLIISGLLFIFPTGNPIMWVYMLAPAFFFLSAGISRGFQAKEIQKLIAKNEPDALPPARSEYIKPMDSIYKTDDLTAQPLSITERTTRHLEIEEAPKPVS